MRRHALIALPLTLILASCSLIAPYTITFTTPKDAEVDPSKDTLDFVVSAATLAYVSEVHCDGADNIELLPVVTDDMQVSTAHNLPLTMLNGAPGAECDITVTAFDQSTTSTARATTSVKIAQAPVVEEPNKEATVTEETPVVEISPAVENAPTVETTPTEETPAQ